MDRVNSQANQATNAPAYELLEKERIRLSPLRVSADDYGLPIFVKVSPMSTVYVKSNFYSVPNTCINKNLTVKLRADLVDIYDKCELVASHKRCFEKKRRILLEEHFAPTLARKPRGNIMFKRERIRELGMEAEEYLTELVFSNYQWEGHIFKLYEMLKTYGREKTLSAISSCLSSDLIGAEYVEATLVMDEHEMEIPIDANFRSIPPNSFGRNLKDYEAFAIKLDGGEGK
jgi:hypothetical protein